MENKVLIVKEFSSEFPTEEYFFEINQRVYSELTSLRNEENQIDVATVFGVAEILDTVKNVTIIFCEEEKDDCYISAIMKNATVYKKSFNVNWLFCYYNAECDSNNAYIIPKKNRKKIKFKGKYLYCSDEKLKEHIKQFCVPENTAKKDTSDIDARLLSAKTYDELYDISAEYDDTFHWYEKSLEIWEKEYQKNEENTDIMFQYALSNMDCCNYDTARVLFEKLFGEKQADNYYLSRLAILYFVNYYNFEAKNIADMITDQSLLDDWGYPYDYIASYAPIHINVDTVLGNSFLKHKMNLGFMDMPLPEIIETASGIKRYMDPVRKKGIPVTKEETVRQKVLRYLIDVCKFPETLIVSEDHLAHYEKNATIRADITVRENNKTLLIVECKEPDVVLDGEPVRQLFGYNDILKSKYLLLTNGRDSYIFQKNKSGSYDSIMTLPTYADIKNGNKIAAMQLKKSEIKRPSVTQMQNSEIIKQYKNDGMYVGVNTLDEKVPFILNLLWAFLDTESTVEGVSGYGVCIQKDYLTVDMKVSNASGGSFPGKYRQFLVKDRNNEQVVVSFAVLGTYAESKTKGGYTSLVCGVDRTSYPIARLELRLDVSFEERKNKIILFHNGIRSRKKTQTTIDYVKSISPELVENNLIFLGEFEKNKLIDIKDSNVKDFILRLTSYLLLRDELAKIS